MPVSSKKAKVLYTGTRGDADIVSGFTRFNQQGGSAPCSITGNLTSAPVRIPQLNGSRGAVIRLSDQNPAVGAHAGVAMADRAGQCGRIARLHGHLLPPGEQKVVARSVRFRKRDLHLFAMVDIYVNTSHRRSFHHNLPPQDKAGFLKRGIHGIT